MSTVLNPAQFESSLTVTLHYYHYIQKGVTSEPRSKRLDEPGEDLQFMWRPLGQEDGDHFPVPELREGHDRKVHELQGPERPLQVP